MKNKIKNLFVLALGMLVINGCNVLAIPTFVSKDVSLGVILINNLQDKTEYSQDITLDLSSLVSQDQLNAIKEIKLTEATFTLNTDYENSQTGSKSLKGALSFYKFQPSGSYFTAKPFLAVDGINNEFFQPNVPKKGITSSGLLFEDLGNAKDLIVDGKIKLHVFLRAGSFSNPENFNDNSFSFRVSIKTEVLLEE